MTKKKTKRIYLRITEEEYDAISRRSKPFQSMTNFIKRAISEFSDSTVAESMETRRNLAKNFAEMDEKLSHVGGNLNQAMKRINEAAVEGHPYQDIMQTRLLPIVKECYELCIDIRTSTRDITQKLIKR